MVETSKIKRDILMLDKELDELYEDKDPLKCEEKCINNIIGKCVKNDWGWRLKLDKKEMKLNC